MFFGPDAGAWKELKPVIAAGIEAAEEQMGMYSSAEESQRLAGSLEKMRIEHAALMVEWEELATQLEEQRA